MLSFVRTYAIAFVCSLKCTPFIFTEMSTFSPEFVSNVTFEALSNAGLKKLITSGIM